MFTGNIALSTHFCPVPRQQLFICMNNMYMHETGLAAVKEDWWRYHAGYDSDEEVMDESCCRLCGLGKTCDLVRHIRYFTVELRQERDTLPSTDAVCREIETAMMNDDIACIPMMCCDRCRSHAHMDGYKYRVDNPVPPARFETDFFVSAWVWDYSSYHISWRGWQLVRCCNPGLAFIDVPAFIDVQLALDPTGRNPWDWRHYRGHATVTTERRWVYAWFWPRK